MNPINNQDISAFPIAYAESDLTEGYGLTKRELFAAMASANQEEGWIGVTVVMQSISLADELIKQLNFTGE